MKRYIGTVRIVTEDNQEHVTEIFRDVTQLKQSFIHPHHVLTTFARQQYSELENVGIKIQSVIIDDAEIIW